MTARFDRSALALNVTEAKGAYGKILALMTQITAYTGALEALDLNPVEAFGAKIDAFQNLPGLRSALATARDHTPAWGPISNGLLMQLVYGAVTFTQALPRTSADIEKILGAATAAGRALTTAEMNEIVAKLQGLETLLKSDRDKIATLRTSTVDLTRVIAGDYAVLTTGAQRIDEAIPAAEKATMDEALKHISPESRGIFNMILEYGAKIRAKLVATANAVHGLAGANEASQHSLQSLGAAWATVEGKYKSVITALSETGRASDAFYELPILLEVATTSWEQLHTYLLEQFSASFLAMPLAAH